MKSRIDTLRVAIEARQSEIDALLADDNITPEGEARAAELLDAQEADQAEAVRLAALAERAVKASTVPASPTFMRKPTVAEANEVGVRYLRGAELRDAALRILDDAENVRHLSASSKSKVERLIRTLGDDHARFAIASSRPTYRSAFAKYMAGREAHMTPDEQRAVEEVRAASTTTTAGGFAVPETLDVAVILTNDGVVDPIRAISRVETGTDNSWKGVTSAGVTASWDAEGAEVSDDAPTLAQPEITAYKGNAFIPFSYEIGDDWAGLAEQALIMFADAKARLEGTAFATGTGSAQPKGIVVALDATTYAEVTPTTDGSFGAVDLFKVFNALPARYRQNATWVMPISTMNHIRNFSSSSAGTHYTVDLTSGYGFRVLGRPAYENSSMTDTSTLTTGALNLLVVGDFRNYLIYDRVGASVEYIPHLFSTGNGRPTGQRGWQFWWRTGADMTSPSTQPGFRLLQNQ